MGRLRTAKKEQGAGTDQADPPPRRARPPARPRLDAGGAGIAALTAAAALALLVPVLKLWRADLSLPLYRGDDMNFIRMLVTTVVERGGFTETPRLGAPLGQDIGESPEIDALSLALLKVFAVFTSDADLVMNLFYIATFPLTALAAFVALRALGVSRGAAATCALIFAFLPYHFRRNETHLFLSAYWAVPAIGYLIVALLRGDALFERRPGARGWRTWLSRRTALTVAACALVGLTWVYYTAYGLILIAAAAAIAVAVRRDRRTLATGAAVVAAIGVTCLVSLTPYVAYGLKHGDNPAYADREDAENELYALRLMQMVVPVDDHRIGRLATFSEHYSRTAPAPEAGAARLGAIPAIGFAALVAGVLLAALGRRPRRMTFTAAGVGAVVTFLFATQGALGSAFGYLVWPQLRGWNRLSIVIGFLAVLAVALALDAVRSRLPRAALWPALLVLVVAVALFDQTTPANVPAYAAIEREERSDDAFFGAIDRRLRAGAMVFQLPYAPFPQGPITELPYYDQTRGYLHSRDLRWSYGDPTGRAGEWRDDLARSKSAVEALPGVAAAGFAGIEVARRGYPDRGAALERELRRELRVRPIVSADGERSFFDLRPYAAELRRQRTPRQIAALREATLFPPGSKPRRKPVPSPPFDPALNRVR